MSGNKTCLAKKHKTDACGEKAGKHLQSTKGRAQRRKGFIMKRKIALMILAALVLSEALTACQGSGRPGGSLAADLSSVDEEQAEGAGEEKEETAGAENSAEEKEGHAIDHVTYGPVTLSEDLWNLCLEIEKDTEGEISADDAAMVLYYEEEDVPGTESPDAFTEAETCLHGENREDYLNFIRESLVLLGRREE